MTTTDSSSHHNSDHYHHRHHHHRNNNDNNDNNFGIVGDDAVLVQSGSGALQLFEKTYAGVEQLIQHGDDGGVVVISSVKNPSAREQVVAALTTAGAEQVDGEPDMFTLADKPPHNQCGAAFIAPLESAVRQLNGVQAVSDELQHRVGIVERAAPDLLMGLLRRQHQITNGGYRPIVGIYSVVVGIVEFEVANRSVPELLRRLKDYATDPDGERTYPIQYLIGAKMHCPPFANYQTMSREDVTSMEVNFDAFVLQRKPNDLGWSVQICSTTSMEQLKEVVMDVFDEIFDNDVTTVAADQQMTATIVAPNTSFGDSITVSLPTADSVMALGRRLFLDYVESVEELEMFRRQQEARQEMAFDTQGEGATSERDRRDDDDQDDDDGAGHKVPTSSTLAAHSPRHHQQ